MKSSHPRPTIHRSKHLGQYVRTVRALLLKTKQKTTTIPHHYDLTKTPIVNSNQNKMKKKIQSMNQNHPYFVYYGLIDRKSPAYALLLLLFSSSTTITYNLYVIPPASKQILWLPATATIHMQRHPLESNKR